MNSGGAPPGRAIMGATPSAPRVASLDQFRGYTVLGMFLVNFVSGYANVPRWLHFEHTYCSYHDTIMPQFFLAVGFALRLTFLRRLSIDGPAAAYRKFIKRGLGLMLLGAVVYHLTGSYRTWSELTTTWHSQGPLGFFLYTLKRGPFETLTHIGLTTIFVLPVIAAPGWVRALFAAGAGVLHAILSLAFYFEWNMSNPAGIDGGPLGFITWAIPTIAGTLAYDWVTAEPGQSTGGARRMLLWGLVLMVVGYGLSSINRVTLPNRLPDSPTTGDFFAYPPFIPPLSKTWVDGESERELIQRSKREAEAVRNYWTMSQRSGSVTYLTFATGFGLALLAVFRVVCDGWSLGWSFLDLLGRNALAGYLIHSMVDHAISPFTPRDSPAAWVWTMFALYLGVTTVFLRYLDKNKLYLRL